MGIVKKLTIQIHNWFVNCSIVGSTFEAETLKEEHLEKWKKLFLLRLLTSVVCCQMMRSFQISSERT